MLQREIETASATAWNVSPHRYRQSAQVTPSRRDGCPVDVNPLLSQVSEVLHHRAIRPVMAPTCSGVYDGVMNWFARPGFPKGEGGPGRSGSFGWRESLCF